MWTGDGHISTSPRALSKTGDKDVSARTSGNIEFEDKTPLSSKTFPAAVDHSEASSKGSKGSGFKRNAIVSQSKTPERMMENNTELNAVCVEVETTAEGNKETDIQLDTVCGEGEITLKEIMETDSHLDTVCGEVNTVSEGNTCTAMPDKGNLDDGNPGKALAFQDASCGVNRSRRSLSKRNVVQRLGTNTADKPRKCSTEARVETSMRSHALGKSYKQRSPCDFMCVTRKSLARHNNTHNGTNPCKCPLCCYRSTKERSHGVQLRKHTKSKALLCSICGYSSSIKSNLVRHQMSHTRDRLHLCSICGYRAYRRDILVNHMTKHTMDKPYLCSYCGRTFRSNNGLVRHTKSHTGEKPFKCPHCEYRFIDKCSLVGHLFTHSAVGQHKCAFCEFSTDHSRSLQGHMGIHSQQNSSAIPQSNLGIASKTSLDIQTGMPIGIETHACSFCSYSSARKGDFRRHMRTHSVDKPHKCSLCDYTSIRKRDLVIHMQKGKHLIPSEGKDTDEKPHKCSMCDYSSNFKSDLNRHMRSHSGEKPHKCPFCEYGSIRKRDLTTHIKKHSSEQL